LSVLNGKVEGLYGNIDGKTAKAAAGSVSIPMFTHFGVQLDALTGEVSPDNAQGGGLHAFWRDASGLVGFTASHAELGKSEARRFGGEGEYYLDRFTCVTEHY
jgi:hypothetical protein